MQNTAGGQKDFSCYCKITVTAVLIVYVATITLI